MLVVHTKQSLSQMVSKSGKREGAREREREGWTSAVSAGEQRIVLYKSDQQ